MSRPVIFVDRRRSPSYRFPFVRVPFDGASVRFVTGSNVPLDLEIVRLRLAVERKDSDVEDDFLEVEDRTFEIVSGGNMDDGRRREMPFFIPAETDRREIGAQRRVVELTREHVEDVFVRFAIRRKFDVESVKRYIRRDGSGVFSEFAEKVVGQDFFFGGRIR